jgi:transcriptional antiterminator
MSYWFGSEKNKDTLKQQFTQPFTPKLTPEEYKQIRFSDKYICEMYDSNRVLNNLFGYLVQMLTHARRTKSKKMIITESDLEFLCEIASKKIELKGS